MSKFDRKTIANKIHPIVNKIQTSKLVNGITGGMMGAMPITILGAFAALFLNLPIPAYKEFIASAGIAAALKVIIMFTTNFLAVIFGVAIAGNYAKQHDEDGLFLWVIGIAEFLYCYASDVFGKWRSGHSHAVVRRYGYFHCNYC